MHFACRSSLSFQVIFPTCFFALSVKALVEGACRTRGDPYADRDSAAYAAAIYHAAIRERESRQLAYPQRLRQIQCAGLELISHLWFLLVLVVLTTLSMWVFTQMKNRLSRGDGTPASGVSMTKLTLIFILLGVGYAVVRRTIFILYPSILSDGMFNFIVMQTLFYVPFFMLGALAFINPNLKALFTTPSRGCTLGAAFAFVAYLLNQRYGNGDAWMYETEYVITMVMGLWMVNVVFSLGHRLLNFQSARVTYFVNASLFIYLVHHPLTLFFGAYITPHIKSNLLGFLCGLLFVVGIAVILYEIHLRIGAEVSLFG